MFKVVPFTIVLVAIIVCLFSSLCLSQGIRISRGVQESSAKLLDTSDQSQQRSESGASNGQAQQRSESGASNGLSEEKNSEERHNDNLSSHKEPAVVLSSAENCVTEDESAIFGTSTMDGFDISSPFSVSLFTVWHSELMESKGDSDELQFRRLALALCSWTKLTPQHYIEIVVFAEHKLYESVMAHAKNLCRETLHSVRLNWTRFDDDFLRLGELFGAVAEIARGTHVLYLEWDTKLSGHKTFLPVLRNVHGIFGGSVFTLGEWMEPADGAWVGGFERRWFSLPKWFLKRVPFSSFWYAAQYWPSWLVRYVRLQHPSIHIVDLSAVAVVSRVADEELRAADQRRDGVEGESGNLERPEEQHDEGSGTTTTIPVVSNSVSRLKLSLLSPDSPESQHNRRLLEQSRRQHPTHLPPTCVESLGAASFSADSYGRLLPTRCHTHEALIIVNMLPGLNPSVHRRCCALARRIRAFAERARRQGMLILHATQPDRKGSRKTGVGGLHGSVRPESFEGMPSDSVSSMNKAGVYRPVDGMDTGVDVEGGGYDIVDHLDVEWGSVARAIDKQRMGNGQRSNLFGDASGDSASPPRVTARESVPADMLEEDFAGNDRFLRVLKWVPAVRSVPPSDYVVRDSADATGLAHVLRKRGISTVYYAGVGFDCIVWECSFALHSVRTIGGFRSVLISDLVEVSAPYALFSSEKNDIAHGAKSDNDGEVADREILKRTGITLEWLSRKAVVELRTSADIGSATAHAVAATLPFQPESTSLASSSSKKEEVTSRNSSDSEDHSPPAGSIAASQLAGLVSRLLDDGLLERWRRRLHETRWLRYAADDYSIDDIGIFQEAAENDVIVLVFVNSAYLEGGLVQNLVCSFDLRGVANWVLVAVDDAAAQKSISLYGAAHVHWQPDYWEGMQTGQLRDSWVATPQFLELMHKRSMFLYRLLLQTNLNLILTDADTVWLSDPLRHVPFPRSDCDMYTTNDKGRRNNPMGAHDGGMMVWQAGVMFVKNNLRTLLLMEIWNRMMRRLYGNDYNGSLFKDQQALQSALLAVPHRAVPGEDITGEAVRREASEDGLLIMCVLSPTKFPAGHYLFGERCENKQTDYEADHEVEGTSKVVIAHASINAKEEKSACFERHGLWVRERCKKVPGRQNSEWNL